MCIAIITPNYPSEPIDGNSLTMSPEVTLGLKKEGHEIFKAISQRRSFSVSKESMLFSVFFVTAGDAGLEYTV